MTTPKPDLGRLKIDRSRAGPPNRSPLRFPVILAGFALGFVAVTFLWLRRGAAIEVTTARVEITGQGAGGEVGVTANGYVVARTRASVSSRITGRLANLSVEEGSVVRRGQVLARLDNADFAAAVAQAEAESLRVVAAVGEARTTRDQLARDLARARDLLGRNLESARTVEELASQLAAAEARIEVQLAQGKAAQAAIAFARANFENTLIRAPFNGTVLRKDAEVGEVVAPVATGGGLTRGAVVTMADLETLEVEVDVNEAYIGQVKSGQPTRVVLDAYPTATFAGQVRQIVPTADRQRATVQVKVSITDRDPRILPEMGARVEFLTAVTADTVSAPKVFVAAGAVRTDGASTFVWVIRDGRVARQAIEAGPVSGGRREVRSGLTGGETVVLDPPANLAEGAAVNVVTN
ncbi:MAG: efflux RND transporter periplasmic adaptor subunit [Gemmatimonadetes bacterium]|nr:efflux RND transporter periplasmic adaptor subunit [Gemmatimonadota bacterium]